jgi:hypothetical protein
VAPRTRRTTRNPKHAERHKAANDAKNREITEALGLGYDMRSKKGTLELCERLFSKEKFPLLGDMATATRFTSGLQSWHSKKKKTCAL